MVTLICGCVIVPPAKTCFSPDSDSDKWKLESSVLTCMMDAGRL